MPKTTKAFGEEEFETTLAIGEEDATTHAVGEEDETTLALGEEGPYETTAAIGEEEPFAPAFDGVQNPFGSF